MRHSPTNVYSFCLFARLCPPLRRRTACMWRGSPAHALRSGKGVRGSVLRRVHVLYIARDEKACRQRRLTANAFAQAFAHKALPVLYMTRGSIINIPACSLYSHLNPKPWALNPANHVCSTSRTFHISVSVRKACLQDVIYTGSRRRPTSHGMNRNAEAAAGR